MKTFHGVGLGSIGIANNGFDPQKRIQLFEDLRYVKIAPSERISCGTPLDEHHLKMHSAQSFFRGGCLKRIRVGVVGEAV